MIVAPVECEGQDSLKSRDGDSRAVAGSRPLLAIVNQSSACASCELQHPEILIPFRPSREKKKKRDEVLQAA